MIINFSSPELKAQVIYNYCDKTVVWHCCWLTFHLGSYSPEPQDQLQVKLAQRISCLSPLSLFKWSAPIFPRGDYSKIYHFQQSSPEPQTHWYSLQDSESRGKEYPLEQTCRVKAHSVNLTGDHILLAEPNELEKLKKKPFLHWSSRLGTKKIVY